MDFPYFRVNPPKGIAQVLHGDLCLRPHLPGKRHGAKPGICGYEDSGVRIWSAGEGPPGSFRDSTNIVSPDEWWLMVII